MGDWIPLGQGTYNFAYRSPDRKRVLKIQKDKRNISDAPKRSARVWNEINPHVPPPASVVNTEHGSGWVCPFIEGRQSTDAEMASGLIEIYNRTGRVVADATAPENFITITSGDQKGQVVCIDIGMALRLQKIEASLELSGHPLFERRASLTSLKTWSPGLKANYNPFFAKRQKNILTPFQQLKLCFLFKKIDLILLIQAF